VTASPVSTAPGPRFDDITAGQQLPPFQRTPTKAQLVMYAGAEDDYMPVHFDHHYAVAAGQPGVINHGWLTYAILLQAVTAWAPPQVADIVATSCRYLRPAFPGEAIVCSGTVTAKHDEKRTVDLELSATDSSGAETTRATVTLRFQ
jgi:acyl dehydratase